MKETLELRINIDFAHLLFEENEGKKLGASVKVIGLSREDSRYDQIPLVAKAVNDKYNKSFFFGWEIKRKYNKKELDNAILLHFKIKTIFEPTGEECGTLYDETTACDICGANRKQISQLFLKKGTIPKKDISKTIGGEILVSEKFVKVVTDKGLRGLQFTPVNFKQSTLDYYQLTASTEIELSNSTIVGINPFNLLTYSDNEIYECPRGDTIGLNILSEPYVYNIEVLKDYDFFLSRQTIGVKRGLLRPEHIYFCSQFFRKIVEEAELTGFEFEITNIL